MTPEMANASALVSNSMDGNYKNVRILLDQGVDPNATDDDGWSSIHSASSKGQLKVLKLLVSFGARIAQKDVEGFTALHYAARYGHWKCCEYLMEVGIPVDCINSTGDTPYDMARSGRHIRVANKLKKEMDKFKSVSQTMDNMERASTFLDDDNGSFSNMTIQDSPFHSGYSQRGQVRVSPARAPSVHSDQFTTRSGGFGETYLHTPPISGDSPLSISANKWDRFLDAIRAEYPDAYDFWIESFGHEHIIPIDRFNFALELYNADRTKLPRIRLREMDPGMQDAAFC